MGVGLKLRRSRSAPLTTLIVEVGDLYWQMMEPDEYHVQSRDEAYVQIGLLALGAHLDGVVSAEEVGGAEIIPFTDAATGSDEPASQSQAWEYLVRKAYYQAELDLNWTRIQPADAMRLGVGKDTLERVLDTPPLDKILEGVWGFGSGEPGVRHGGRSLPDLSDAEAALAINGAAAVIHYLLELDAERRR